MITRLLSLSIKTKITFTIFFIILFFSSGIVYLMKSSLTKNSTNLAINITKDLISVNETTITKSLLEDDYWSIFKVLKSLSNLEIIRSIAFIDNQNRIIAHTSTTHYKIFQTLDINKFKGITIPLMSDNIKLGTFVVTINKDAASFLFKDINKHFIFSIIILAIMSFLIAYFISKRILKRLHLLNYNAIQIQNGNLEKIQKAKSIEKDEISLFQDSMEIILTQLKNSTSNEEKLKIFYHEILKGLNTLIIITDHSLKIIYNNEHILKKHILVDNQFVNEVYNIINKNIKNNIDKFVLNITSKNDDKFYLYAIVDKIDERYSFSFTNITKLKFLEEKQQLANSFELIGEISSSVVHEIKNYLQPLKLLVGQKTIDQEDRGRVIKVISKIDQVVNNFLNAGRPIDKNLSEIIYINKIIENQLFLFGNTMQEKELNLIKNYTQDLCIELGMYDFELIIRNLLKNAIEATPINGVIEIKTFSEDEYAVFQIINNGEFIPKEIIKNLSKPFFTTKEKGSGIGLYTVYKIVYLYDGFIEVSSIANKTSFKIYFPRKEL